MPDERDGPKLQRNTKLLLGIQSIRLDVLQDLCAAATIFFHGMFSRATAVSSEDDTARSLSMGHGGALVDAVTQGGQGITGGDGGGRGPASSTNTSSGKICVHIFLY